MFYRILSFVFVITFSFSSALYAAGAGVLPIFDDGTVLVGKEPRSQGYAWSDFGGKQDPNESLPQTAFREFKEETGHYSFPKISLNQIIKASYVDHHHQVGSYRLYFVRIHGKKPSLHEINKNAKKAKKKLGHKAHVEKVEWKYVNAQQLLNAAHQNGKFPGTNENIFGPAKAILKKPATQAIFQNLTGSLPKMKPIPFGNKQRKQVVKKTKKSAPHHKGHSHKKHSHKKSKPTQPWNISITL